MYYLHKFFTTCDDLLVVLWSLLLLVVLPNPFHGSASAKDGMIELERERLIDFLDRVIGIDRYIIVCSTEQEFFT